jgi:hypothetical protein
MQSNGSYMVKNKDNEDLEFFGKDGTQENDDL